MKKKKYVTGGLAKHVAGGPGDPPVKALNLAKLTKKQYKDLYDSGRLATYDSKSDTYQARVLPEVSISAKSPKSFKDFFDRYGKKKAAETTSLTQAMFAAPAEYLMGLPQAATTYLLDSEKNLEPSKALGIENQWGAVATDMVLDPTNLVGAGLLGKGKAAATIAASKESGLLSKAYKLNPWAFKPDAESYYRVVGRAAIDDALESGVIRSKAPQDAVQSGINLGARPTAFPSFSKGKISTEYANGLPDHGLIETTRPMKASTLGRHGKGTTQFPVDDSGQYMKEFPLEDAKIYKKDWLRGYKEVSKPAVEDPAKTLKSSMLNPLEVLDNVIPKPLTPGNLIGMDDGWANYSPLNLVPWYGKKLKSKPSDGLVGFRKFGSSLDDVIESQSLRPKGTGMGSKQIKGEGNWAEPGSVNENYPGVFEATMNPQVEGSNIKLERLNRRRGVVGTTKENNTAIPLTDPGLSFNRRLPFSNRYVSIDKEKLINNEFQLATMAPHLQNLAEKYVIWTGVGAAAAKTGFPQLHEANKKYIIEPAKKKIKELSSKYATGGPITPEQEKANTAFLQNWYANRKITDPYLQGALDLDRNDLVNRSKTIPSPTYVDQVDPKEPRVTGRLTPDNKLLLSKVAPAHVDTHEKNHYINKFDSYTRSTNGLVTQNELKSKDEMQGIYKDKYEYFSDPDEVHSRIMVMRQQAGFRPDQFIEEKDVDEYLKNYKGDIDNVNDLLELSKDKKALLNMLNFMVSNNQKDGTQYAATGGALNGGPVKPPSNINRNAVKNFDKTKLEAVQLDLKNKGLYKGNIDGIYGPLTESAIEAYNLKYGGIQLPEFNVVSTNDPNKVETLAALEAEQRLNNKPNMYNTWDKSGKPKIEISNNIRTRAHYNPFTNTATVGNNINLAHKDMYLEDEKVANIFMSNPRGARKQLEDENLLEYDHWGTFDGNYKIAKQIYAYPFHENNLSGYKTETDDIIAELSHSMQNKKGQLGVVRAIKDWQRNPFISNSGYNEQYKTPGTAEYEAHKIIQPALDEYSTRPSNTTIDVGRHYPKNYADRLRDIEQQDMKKINKYEAGGVAKVGQGMSAVAPVASLFGPVGMMVGAGAGAVGSILQMIQKKDKPDIVNASPGLYATGGPVDPIDPFNMGHFKTNVIPFKAGEVYQPSIQEQMRMNREAINAKTQQNISNWNDARANERTRANYNHEQMLKKKDIALEERRRLIEANTAAGQQKMQQNRENFQKKVRGYADGGDVPLSSNSFQVKGNPQTTDGNRYNMGGQQIALDHNEVVTNTSQGKFVYSDKLKDPQSKQKFSVMAAKIEKATGKAEKKLKSNPYDPAAKATIAHNKMLLQDVANRQEMLAHSLGLRNRPQDQQVQGYYKGGPIPYEGFDVEDFQNFARSHGYDIAADKQWGPKTANVYGVLRDKYLETTGMQYTNGKYMPRTQVVKPTGGFSASNYTEATNPVTGEKYNKTGFTSVTPSNNNWMPATIHKQESVAPLARLPQRGIGFDIQDKYPYAEGNMLAPGVPENEREYSITATSDAGTLQERSQPVIDQLKTLADPITGKATNAAPEDLSYKTPWTTGDYFKVAELLGKSIGAFGKPEIEKPMLDTTRISQQTFDPTASLQQIDRQQRNFMNSINAPTQGLRRAIQSSSLATGMNQKNQVLSQYQQMNQQAKAQYEDRVGNQRRYNIQSQFQTNQMNAQNRAAKDMVQQNFFSSLGQFGEDLNRKRYSSDLVNYLRLNYPDAWKDEDLLNILGIKQKKDGSK